MTAANLPVPRDPNTPARQNGGPVNGLNPVDVHLWPLASPAQPMTQALDYSGAIIAAARRFVAELEAITKPDPCTVPGCGTNLSGWTKPQRAAHARSHGFVARVQGWWQR
jgi:hypothetical protein